MITKFPTVCKTNSFRRKPQAPPEGATYPFTYWCGRGFGVKGFTPCATFRRNEYCASLNNDVSRGLSGETGGTQQKTVPEFGNRDERAKTKEAKGCRACKAGEDQIDKHTARFLD